MISPPAPADTSRRTLLLGLGGIALAGCSPRAIPSTPGVRAPGGPLFLLAEAQWAHGLELAGTAVGGLSGIDYDSQRGEYLLLSDDRSDKAPARYYTARWERPAAGGAPLPVGMHPLLRGDGTPRPPRGHALPGVPVPDPEALRLRPDTDTLLWTSEGDVPRGFGPALYECARDGRLLRSFALPPMFAADPEARRGPRDNLSFEGLALTPDARHAWVAMENALIEDGPSPTLDAPGGPCRFTCFDLARGTAVRQIAYVPDAIPLRPLVPGTYADNGVSEVLMLDADRMLVLERAYAAGRGNSLRLYAIDTRQATDTLGLERLRPDNHRAAAKTPVADFASLGLSRLDNSEGMCWGPPLPDGRRQLVVVSDNNFNPLQITQFAAFAFKDPP